MKNKIIKKLHKIAAELQELNNDSSTKKLKKKTLKVYDLLVLLDVDDKKKEKKKKTPKKIIVDKPISVNEIKIEEPKVDEPKVIEKTQTFTSNDEIYKTDFNNFFKPKEEFVKNDAEDLSPKEEDLQIDEKPKVENNSSTKKLAIGLNDKIGFIKHLFNNNEIAYSESVSLLNNSINLSDAKLVLAKIKAENNGFSGAEVYENRLLELIELKFY